MAIMKKAANYVGKSIDNTSRDASGLVGAVAGSQIPNYMDQYTQALGGAVDEAAKQVAGWQNIADKVTGGSLDKLVSAYQSGGEPAITALADKVAGDVARHGSLESALSAITNAEAWERPFAFLANLDYSTSVEAIKNFSLGIPLTWEAAAYTVAGFVVGAVAYKLAKVGVNHAFKYGNKVVKTIVNSMREKYSSRKEKEIILDPGLSLA